MSPHSGRGNRCHARGLPWVPLHPEVHFKNEFELKVSQSWTPSFENRREGNGKKLSLGWGSRRPSGGKLQRMQFGEGPSGVHTFQIPLLCRRSSWTPRPRAFTAQGRGRRNPRAPASQHSTLATLPWGTRGGGAQSLGGRRGGRSARRRGRRAGGGLAARPHVAGPQGGGGGGDGEPRGRVYISAKFPDGRSLPALSAFPARPAQPHRPGRSFPEKNARRAAGPWSRPEPLRGKRRGAAAASGATGARGLRAAPGETPAAAGEGQGSNAGWGATCGRGRGRPGTSGLRRRRAVGANARPREGRSGGKGPRTAGLRTRAPPAWALRTPGPRGRLGTRCRRSSPEQGLRGYALEPRLHPLARTDGDFWASPGQFLPSNRLAFFAGGIEPIPQLGFPN